MILGRSIAFRKTGPLLRYLTIPLVSCALIGCMGRVVTYESQLLSEADSLFDAGNFEVAKLKYAKVIDTRPESEAARSAQFNLGYINVYYDNPFANWEAALREFKAFSSMYPDDVRIDQANSWIRILVVLQSFKKEYKGTTTKLEQMNKSLKEPDVKATRRVNLDMVTESLKSCYDDRDSLNRSIEGLKNVILEMERKCQQAQGR
jgi:outer membrane protein assembly factor BamD (BamD/ComL family)